MELTLGQARRRAVFMLGIASGIAAVLSAVLFAAVLHGEWMTGFFSASAEFVFRQPAWAVVIAASPLAGVLLVGYGYASRAIKRRRAE